MLIFPMNSFPVTSAFPLEKNIFPLFVVKLTDIDVGNREYTV